MFKGRKKSRRGGGIEKVPLKGLFDEGVWKCNCDPRLPADHFQTKNGGKNHGRWCKEEIPMVVQLVLMLLTLVYTCQKAQPNRCNFFLWDDEAKPREESAVLNNSRSEPHTPSKKHAFIMDDGEPITPYTPSKSSKSSSVFRPIQQTPHDTDKDLFEWSDSEDDEATKIIDRVSMPPPPETPRKAIKTDTLASPGKRRYDEVAQTTTTPDKDDDVFTTPSTGLRGKDLFSTAGLLSPAITPSKPHDKPPLPPEDSELAFEILDNLRDMHVDLNTEAVTVVKTICTRYTMKMQGVARGRDISRQVIKNKEAKIVELQGKIAGLEAERETNRAVIRHLRRDVAESNRSG